MINDNGILSPSEGMMLTNGDTYSYRVYLGTMDSPDNWYLIDEQLAIAIMLQEEQRGDDDGSQ